MIDAARFRTLFPAFADLAKFPDDVIAWELGGAGQECGPRWGTKRERGIMLLAAHRLTLWAAAHKATDGTGGIDAGAGPVVSESKTIGSISKSIGRAGPGAVNAPDAGNFAATTWGSQYFELRKTVGIGGVVL